jgi:type I restriction enzyme S subunit
VIKWVKLQDVAATSKNAIVDGPFGSNLKLIDYVKAGIPVLQGKNITNNEFRWFDVRFITEEKAEELGRSKVRLGDLLIVKIGSIGYSAILDDLHGFPYAIIPANLAKVTLNEKVVFPKFVAYWLSSLQATRKLISLASKTAQPALSLTKLKEFPIPLIPFPIQKQIAAILEKADTVREKRRQANQLTEQFLRSSFLEMFGDPVTNPKRWEKKTLGEMSEKFSDGPFGSNLKTEHYTPSGIRVVRLQNIGVGEFIDEDRAYVSETHFQSILKHKCIPGDVLIGTLGDPNLRACILPAFIPIALNKADCIQMRPKKDVCTPEYACSLLNQPSTLAMAFGMIHGQTRARINMGRLRELVVPCPPVSQQAKFGTLVKVIETLRAKQKESEKELENLFNSLMQRAFAGELV